MPRLSYIYIPKFLTNQIIEIEIKNYFLFLILPRKHS